MCNLLFSDLPKTLAARSKTNDPKSSPSEAKRGMRHGQNSTSKDPRAIDPFGSPIRRPFRESETDEERYFSGIAQL
jgi:hypothetical protein